MLAHGHAHSRELLITKTDPQNPLHDSQDGDPEVYGGLDCILHGLHYA